MIFGKHVSIRSHITPRLSVLLRQHKRHKVDFAKSPGTKDTVIAVAIIFLVICAMKEKKGLSLG